ncbi:uncharacterized protein RHOBADRAFT_51913 [Rhodotorula graminis WP1]|uniref:Uncharacterized protein n=1 Tax=Rhodotorula graminis (strain WP1) TaxID=578459 RepID=A0A194S876_RHOGW|nr:uncharacterized protein RHOBADRAFT_51913 [Rhodotorula graminis WP1]KPV76933.1 hypothetical protein RHOBADRAFT_51913 [Rhodotorula graminis WP1]
MVGGHIIPLERAVYCANPDAVETCLRICAAPDQVSIGVRVGSYLQAVSYFVLVLVAPDEGGAESVWLGLSISFSFLFALIMQLVYGSVTLHHAVIITLLSHLPYISTLAGMNTLTSYEVLGPAGVRFLQSGMILKSVLTALIWAACLWAWYVGQLPGWTFLQFRQANCFSSTSLVVWMYPVSPKDERTTLSTILIVTYSAFWFLVLCLGSYWTLIAPRVLLRRGGHLRDPKKKKVKGFEALRRRVEDDIGDLEHEHGHGREREHDGAGESGDSSDDERRRAFIKRNPKAYHRDEDDGIGLAMMTLRSMSKSRRTPSPTSTPLPVSCSASTSSLPSYRSSRTDPSRTAAALSEAGGVQASRTLSPPSATRGMTALSPWSKGLRGSDQDAAVRWTRRQAESRHHFIIWPLVALLLVFVIVTTELQMVANDVFTGEMELDFPGALTLALALPTLWAVAKSVNRIREGRRPTPTQRRDETFWEIASGERAAQRRRADERRRERRAYSSSSSHESSIGESASESEPVARGRSSRR